MQSAHRPNPFPELVPLPVALYFPPGNTVVALFYRVRQYQDVLEHEHEPTWAKRTVCGMAAVPVGNATGILSRTARVRHSRRIRRFAMRPSHAKPQHQKLAPAAHDAAMTEPSD